MKRIRQRPYLTPLPERLVIEQWIQIIGEHQVPLEQRLPGWDAGSNIHVRCDLTVDVKGIFQDCRLERDARLRLALVWDSPGTKLRGCGNVLGFSSETSPMSVSLSATIEGKLLADKLNLSVKLLFVSGGSTQHQLIPRMSGSILLDLAPFRVQLEGDGARFPIELIDFTATNFPAGAAWYLNWDADDLDQLLLGDVRLYVNSHNAKLASAVSNPQSEAEGIREAMRLDLAQTLIRGALENEAFIQNPDRYATGTIGAAVRAMIRLYFEGYELKSVREIARAPHKFSATLQEKMKIFDHDQ